MNKHIIGAFCFMIITICAGYHIAITTHNYIFGFLIGAVGIIFFILEKKFEKRKKIIEGTEKNMKEIIESLKRINEMANKKVSK